MTETMLMKYRQEQENLLSRKKSYQNQSVCFKAITLTDRHWRQIDYIPLLALSKVPADC